MLKLAVLVSGSGTNLQAIIDRIEDGSVRNAKIEVVISNNPNAYALTRAKNHGICARCISPKSFETREAFNDALLEALTEAGIDLVVLAGFMVVVPPAIISKFRNKIINIHPSLIPSFCGPGHYGMHVHEKVLARGVKVTGATVHFVSSEVDGGPIILQEACNIDDLDNAEDIQARVLEIEHRILPKAVALFCDGKIIVENERAKVI